MIRHLGLRYHVSQGMDFETGEESALGFGEYSFQSTGRSDFALPVNAGVNLALVSRLCMRH